MKRYSLFLFLFFYSLSHLHAQFEFMQFENASYNLRNNFFSSHTLKINHVKSFTLKQLSGKEYFKTKEYTYNSGARLISINSFRKNGKKKYSNLYKYLNDTLITNYNLLNHKSDTTRYEKYVYDSKYRLIHREYKFYFLIFFNRDWKYQYQYNTLNKLSAYSQIDKKGKDNYRYEYDFYDNGSRKETRYFNQKNRLKYRWTYECDQKGELVSNSIKQANFCTKKELHNDGSFIEVFDFTDDKGRHTKTICYYSKDSLLTAYETFTKRNKLQNKWEYIYDKNGNAIQTLYFKSKELKKKFVYTYNEKNLCVKIDFFNKNGKLNNSFIYDYSYSN